MLLQNKVAVVTGANKGIGKKIVEIFSENGAEIFAFSRTSSDSFLDFVEKLKTKNKSSIHVINMDLENSESINIAFDKLKKFDKKIDVLVNNAATIKTSLFQMTTVGQLKETFNINFFSQVLFTQKMIKILNKKKSSIIFTSSTSGTDGNIGRTSYSASKAAINNLTKVLSKELGRLNIRVNAVEPGLTDTDMLKNNTENKIIEKIKDNNISLGRIAKPEEIANSILFLASDLSSYISGQVIRVDGGLYNY